MKYIFQIFITIERNPFAMKSTLCKNQNAAYMYVYNSTVV